MNSYFVAHKIIETRQVLDNELQEWVFNDLEEKTETVPSIEEYKSPKKVKCEYCGSIVDNCTNCPNCGAVLPQTKEVCVPCDTVLHIGPTADDLVYMDDERGRHIVRNRTVW